MELEPSNHDKSTGIYIPVKGRTLCMEDAIFSCQNDQQQSDIEYAIEEFRKPTVCKNCGATYLDHCQTIQATEGTTGTCDNRGTPNVFKDASMSHLTPMKHRQKGKRTMPEGTKFLFDGTCVISILQSLSKRVAKGKRMLQRIDLKMNLFRSRRAEVDPLMDLRRRFKDLFRAIIDLDTAMPRNLAMAWVNDDMYNRQLSALCFDFIRQSFPEETTGMVDTLRDGEAPEVAMAKLKAALEPYYPCWGLIQQTARLAMSHIFEEIDALLL